jgi:AcrR family transcriptional regulator
MNTAAKGRPRAPAIDRAALKHTLALLQERGYDGLRMKDVAAAAGIGLGSMYRRWPGKQELVAAALRADVAEHTLEDSGDAVADLVASLVRVSGAVAKGLGRLVGARLDAPDSELAKVALDAKLAPLTATVARHLQRVDEDGDNLPARASAGPGFIIWHAVLYGIAPDKATIRQQLLPLMGVTTTDPGGSRRSSGSAQAPSRRAR